MRQLIVFVSLDKDAIEMAENCGLYEIAGFLDTDPAAAFGSVPNLGDDRAWQDLQKRHTGIRAVMAVDPPQLKKRLVLHYGMENLETVTASDAVIAATVHLGDGCLIQYGVKIMPDVELGCAAKVNINATVHHDCSIGDYCTLAPGCQLLGNVNLADEVFIGTGAIVLPGVSIGTGAIVGAGAVVTRDVAKGDTVVGVPAAISIKDYKDE